MVIEDLVLRIPGVREEEVPSLVEEIMRRVQENLRGSGRVGHYHAAELKVRVPANAKRSDLIGAIANQLTERLR